MPHRPEPRKIRLSDLHMALRSGLHRFKQTMPLSLGYSSLFTLIGVGLYLILEVAMIAPLSHSLAMGFMLFGPALLAGFFAISNALDEKREPALSDIVKGFRHAPSALWGFSLLCLFLFFIWITEAATVYAFVVGAAPVGFMAMLPPEKETLSFLFFTSLGGLLLSYILFVASAFTVPLIIYTQCGIVQAVVASARAVFRNFLVMVVWALLLLALVMGSAWLLPLLPFTLPVAAYTTLALFRAVFIKADEPV